MSFTAEDIQEALQDELLAIRANGVTGLKLSESEVLSALGITEFSAFKDWLDRTMRVIGLNDPNKQDYHILRTAYGIHPKGSTNDISVSTRRDMLARQYGLNSRTILRRENALIPAVAKVASNAIYARSQSDVALRERLERKFAQKTADVTSVDYLRNNPPKKSPRKPVPKDLRGMLRAQRELLELEKGLSDQMAELQDVMTRLTSQLSSVHASLIEVNIDLTEYLSVDLD